MPTVNFYPPAGGAVRQVRRSIDESWTQIRNGAGTNDDNPLTEYCVEIRANMTQLNKWSDITRAILNFDTSLLAGKKVVAATLWLKPTGALLHWTWVPEPVLIAYGIICANPLAPQKTDYDKAEDVPLSDPVTFTTWLNGNGQPFPFLAAGLSHINTHGITQLVMREGSYDGPDIPPAWVPGFPWPKDVAFYIQPTGAAEPHLEVTYEEGNLMGAFF